MSRRRNETIDWRFSITDAREKLKRLQSENSHWWRIQEHGGAENWISTGLSAFEVHALAISPMAPDSYMLDRMNQHRDHSIYIKLHTTVADMVLGLLCAHLARCCEAVIKISAGKYPNLIGNG